MQMYYIKPPIVLMYILMKDSCSQTTNPPAVLKLGLCEVWTSESSVVCLQDSATQLFQPKKAFYMSAWPVKISSSGGSAHIHTLTQRPICLSHTCTKTAPFSEVALLRNLYGWIVNFSVIFYFYVSKLLIQIFWDNTITGTSVPRAFYSYFCFHNGSHISPLFSFGSHISLQVYFYRDTLKMYYLPYSAFLSCLETLHVGIFLA